MVPNTFRYLVGLCHVYVVYLGWFLTLRKANLPIKNKHIQVAFDKLSESKLHGLPSKNSCCFTCVFQEMIWRSSNNICFDLCIYINKVVDQSDGETHPHSLLHSHPSMFLDGKHILSRWWFQIFFIFIPTWGNDPI